MDRNGTEPQMTSVVITAQPWGGWANQLCLAKLTPGIWSTSQFTTPKSASTIHANTCEDTSCGIAQASMRPSVMSTRTQVDTRRISNAMPRPSRTDSATDTTVKVAVRRTTSQKTGSV